MVYLQSATRTTAFSGSLILQYTTASTATVTESLVRTFTYCKLGITSLERKSGQYLVGSPAVSQSSSFITITFVAWAGLSIQTIGILEWRFSVCSSYLSPSIYLNTVIIVHNWYAAKYLAIMWCFLRQILNPRSFNFGVFILSQRYNDTDTIYL